ncbi:carboxypeptidase regulatory-like domain-containing protein [Burkholderia gladioli]|uniref:carboxypeptidase regulatory-like domain-containing protein n=1 Tax=Burkholderia gladioli TaxID=28095 RepID=UPI00164103E3|nr:carboxypeptidase regulatory-like domain-containing protein [Burkholderia gladioli]
MKTNHTKLRAARWIGLGIVAAATMAACGGGGDSGGGGPVGPQTVASGKISGTAAVGAAMANASITIACAQGNGAGTATASGAYALSFAFNGPCSITGSTGSATLHSLANGSGTFNVTPLTELMLVYLAAELGTDLNGLLAGLGSNTAYQAAASNNADLAAAQGGVAAVLKKLYGITLSTSAFLTTAFTPGQPGADADLDALQAAGAFTSNGTPSATLLSAVAAAGTTANSPTGGTGGSTSGTP